MTTGGVVVLLLAILTLTGLYLVLPALVKLWLRRRFLTRIRRSGKLCLTFDDGPSPAVTPAVLDILAAARMRATFCVQGRLAERHPDLLQRMVQEHHQVIMHGYDHLHPWRSLPGRCLADLRRGDKAVGAAEGRFLRPPYGKLDLLSLVDSVLRRRILVYWSVDPEDYRAGEADVILARLAGRLQPGEVILLHDGQGRRERRRERDRTESPDRSTDVLPQALKAITEEIARHGVPTATVAQALG